MKLATLLFASASLVGASHFRYGSIQWQQTEGNSVDFDITTAWTRDYGYIDGEGNVNFEVKGHCYYSEEKGVLMDTKYNDADYEDGTLFSTPGDFGDHHLNKGVGETTLPTVGDLIVVNDLTGMPRLHFGDGEWTYLSVCVTAVSVDENWFFGHSSASHTYDYPTDYNGDRSCTDDHNSNGICDPWTGGEAEAWEVTYTGCCKFGNDDLEQPWSFDSGNQNDWPRPGGNKDYAQRGEVNNLGQGEGPEDGPERDWDKPYGYNLPETRKPWRLVSRINLLHESASPGVVSLPIVSVPAGEETCFYMGSYDANHAAGGLYRAGNDYEYGADTSFYQTDGINDSNTPTWMNGVDHTPITSHSWDALSVSSDGEVCVNGDGLEGLYNAVVMISNGEQISREEWAHQDNQFNRLTTGATTPVDFLVRVLPQEGNHSPEQEYSTEAYPAVHTLYEGFWYGMTVAGADADEGDRISFTTINTPSWCAWSTVNGVNPGSMDLSCMPCSEDCGLHIICTEAVDNSHTGSDVAYASPQMCLAANVVPDPAPTVDPYGGGNQDDVLVMGRTHTFDVISFDENGGDSVTTTASNMPEGATFDGTTFTWTPGHDQGGMTVTIDFTGHDQADACGNDASTTTVSRTLHVRTCVYDVQEEQQLQEIAEIYQTDWMTLWSLNPCNHEDGSFCHPDYFLTPGTTINVGHFKRVESHDNLYDLAARFGTSTGNIHTMNNGLDEDNLQLGDAICIVPNACDGANNAYGPNGAN